MTDRRGTRTIRRGDLVYYVTLHGGPLPVKVAGPADAPDMVRLKVTARRSLFGYRPGEVFDGGRFSIYTRDARYVRSGIYRWIEYLKVWELES